VASADNNVEKLSPALASAAPREEASFSAAAVVAGDTEAPAATLTWTAATTVTVAGVVAALAPSAAPISASVEGLDMLRA